MALAVTTAVSALGLSIVNVALPAIAEQFAVPMTSVQWATLAYLLATTVSVILIGRLSDSYGRVRLLQVGTSVLIAASLLAAFAPGLGWLVLARAFQGVGAAAMTVLPMALVRELIPRNRIGATMGLLGSSMATGMALGPALGGLLVARLGWRGVFAVLIALGLVTLLTIILGLPAHRPSRAVAPTFDLPGALLLTLTLSAFAIAVTLAPGGLLGVGSLALLTVGAGLAFIAVELRAEHPIIDLQLLRQTRLLPASTMAMLAAYVMMTFTVVTPFFLTQGLALGDMAMGLTLAIGPLVAIGVGVPAGKLVDHWGPTRTMRLGLTLMITAALAFVLLPPLLGLTGFVIAAVILTPGNQLFMASNNTATMQLAGTEHQGTASGTLNLARNLGFIIGTGTAALLFESVATRSGEVAGATAGFQASFTVAALVGGLALMLALRRRAHPQG